MRNIHTANLPSTASTMAMTLTATAKTQFCRMTCQVRAAMRRVGRTSSRLSERITTPAAATAMPQPPEPIATPTEAAARAEESFMPVAAGNKV